MQKYLDSQKNWITRKYAENQLRTVHNNQHWYNNKKVLDVGCGKGVLEATLPNTEIESCDVADPGFYDISMTICSADKLEFGDNRFDTVFMLGVIEHTNNPEAALTECQRVIKPGGKLIMSIPNGLFWSLIKILYPILYENLKIHSAFNQKELMACLDKTISYKLNRKINILKFFFDMYEIEVTK